MYTVFKFKMNDAKEKTITATGILPKLEEDSFYTLTGVYGEHPRYGMQFQVQSASKNLPTQKEGVIRYFSGIQFPGIGEKTAQKIVDTLGESCLNDLKEHPELLERVKELSPDKRQVIIDGIAQEKDGMEDLVQFLNVQGIGVRNLVRLNRAYGSDALKKLKANPYRVIEECDGFGFKTADKIALSLGFALDDERRLYAYLVALCMECCVRLGDSYVLEETLEEEYSKAMDGIDYDFQDLLHQAVLKSAIVQEGNRIYPISQYEAENGIASFLSQFPEEQMEVPSLKLQDQYCQALQKDIGITYDEDQIEAIHWFFENPVLILTGGPGTGKTTVVRALVQLFRMIYPDAGVVCCAPTGRAAKRLSELTETNATTIHSLLKWDLETNSFGMNDENPILADLLIIDEFSMVDTHLFYHLCLASSHIKKICIIGDEDQLPSVSPGSVLRDLIACNQFPLKRLNHIYRQKEGSDVITLAHQISHGTANFEEFHKNVAFYTCKDQEIKGNILTIVKGAMEKGYSVNDIQVLSPMYNGPAGIDVLNNALQEYLNPPSPEKDEAKFGYITFRVGDKILQLKNQPDDDVYNGDIGILEEIYPSSETDSHMMELVVNFDGIYVVYTPQSVVNMTLAYCISVHKSQGSEYPIVLLPVSYQQSIMLQRKLLYTAITRAKTSLILLGDTHAFQKGIETLERHPRNTTLVQRFQMLQEKEK